MDSQHGTELVQGAIYEFHKPDPGQRIEVEIVFMHGLQVNADDLKVAYYKTWTTADGTEVWPETWLKKDYPNARILSLAYDSSARKTGTAGNMGPYLLGESLLDHMVSTAGNIGQNDCPVVFVGHSLGGLIAKEIVVRCNSDRANVKHQNLLRNLKAVFFYATPHGGSDLADSLISKIVNWLPFVKKSLLVEYLNPKGTDRTHTHRDFLKAINNKDCKFYVVAEGQVSRISVVSKWIVRENSASFPGDHKFVMHKDADHMTVCKPRSDNDIGYVNLIDCINAVIKEYKGRIKVHLSVDRPVGIQRKIDKVSELLEKPEVSIVGLFGMGGVGKTTLSKEFYNQEALNYVKSCYLENVKSKEVPDVQKELLRGLCGRQLDQKESIEKQHLDMIKDCFLTQKVLVVIDDVSSEDCLRELQVFHTLKSESQSYQSKVVVTGRDRGILPKNSGKVIIRDVNGIRDHEGSDFDLFCRYAFDAVPQADKEEVETKLRSEAVKIVQLCNGLPLSLEVIGKYLGNSKYEDLQQWKGIWADAHDRLQRAESIGGSKDDKLWRSLRMSFDDLGDLEQKMFLDFACIFSEMKSDEEFKILQVKKRLAERIWGSPIGVQNLINKSLLKVEGGFFIMHDQLRDMGRYVLLKEVLKDYPIYLESDSGRAGHSPTYRDFKKLKTESGVPYVASVPLEEEQKRSSQYYSKLRLLSVTECDTRLDDCLSECSGDLRWLNLSRCSGVTEIGIQKVCSFGGLRVLHIFGCDGIQKLPEDIGNSTNLVEIEVVGSDMCWGFDMRVGISMLPDSIGKPKNLKRLVIEDCEDLEVIPNSIEELSEVEHLSFQGCSGLKAIPGTQICTRNLVKLKLPFMPTTCFRPCPRLQRLDIRNRGHKEEFPPGFLEVDMPKLKVIHLQKHCYEKFVVKNPDGSQLVLGPEPSWVPAGCEGGGGPRIEWTVKKLVVRRGHDGSISRLSLCAN